MKHFLLSLTLLVFCFAKKPGADPDPFEFCNTDPGTCSMLVELPLSLDGVCEQNAQGKLEILALVDLFNDAQADGELVKDFQGQIRGGYNKYQLSGRFPIGFHQLKIIARDSCGNNFSKDLPFKVKDCSIFIPACLNGVSIMLEPLEGKLDINGDGIFDRGGWQLKPGQLLAKPIYDCSGDTEGSMAFPGMQRITRYSLNWKGMPVFADQTEIILTCADYNRPRYMETHAWDTQGNHSQCETLVNIQDSRFRLCQANPDSPTIGGIISTEKNQMLTGADILIKGPDSILQVSDFGYYSFLNLKEGHNYTVVPVNDKKPLNGMSTFDIVLISKHILGTQMLDSPYKILAADVNNSKSVTIIDIVLMRKLILGLESKLTKNTSWRFVDAAYRFPNPSNPWYEKVPEEIEIHGIEGIRLGVDFVGYKVGDVNNDASANLE